MQVLMRGGGAGGGEAEILCFQQVPSAGSYGSKAPPLHEYRVTLCSWSAEVAVGSPEPSTQPPRDPRGLAPGQKCSCGAGDVASRQLGPPSLPMGSLQAQTAGADKMENPLGAEPWAPTVASLRTSQSLCGSSGQLWVPSPAFFTAFNKHLRGSSTSQPRESKPLCTLQALGDLLKLPRNTSQDYTPGTGVGGHKARWTMSLLARAGLQGARQETLWLCL